MDLQNMFAPQVKFEAGAYVRAAVTLPFIGEVGFSAKVKGPFDDDGDGFPEFLVDLDEPMDLAPFKVELDPDILGNAVVGGGEAAQELFSHLVEQAKKAGVDLPFVGD